MKFAVIAHQLSETNLALAGRGWRGVSSYLLSPRDALLNLGPGDVALNRLDVSPNLDAVEEGIWIVNQLEAQQVRVLNRPAALLAAHDKLITARLLKAAGVPHPATQRLHSTPSVNGLCFPLVAKPRFGSWGRDVELCVDRKQLQGYITPSATLVRHSPGAAMRAAAPTIFPAVPTPEARELAIAATLALGIDLAGVDLLPAGDGWVVLEVNGAVDVREHYALGPDVASAALESLERAQEHSLLPA